MDYGKASDPVSHSRACYWKTDSLGSDQCFDYYVPDRCHDMVIVDKQAYT